ncbi:hypothetical protein [Mycobacterium servetii]|uniref:Uncharacterized protein n=1 Tax=Mycobacterium servetii TaxID=3237418 RepID=A0ABV4C8D6_9MYCO
MVATAVATPVVGPPVTQTVTLGGSQFGGLIPGLRGALADLATAITPLT